MQTLPHKPPHEIPITSKYIPSVYGAVGDLYKGQGYGFIFEAVSSPVPPVFAVRVKGFGNGGNDIIFVTANKWYDFHFSSLELTTDDLIPSYASYTGAVALNIATAPYAFVRPAYSNPTPASGGGNPLVATVNETQALTRAAPTLITEGAPIANGESAFAVLVDTDGETHLGGNIIGGTIDLYYWTRYPSGNAWGCAMQGLPIPTGLPFARVPVNNDFLAAFGVRQPTDRWLAAANGITTDGNAAQARISMLTQ